MRTAAARPVTWNTWCTMGAAHPLLTAWPGPGPGQAWQAAVMARAQPQSMKSTPAKFRARLRGTTPGSLALNLAGVDFIDCGCARAITAACQAWPGPGPGQAVSGDASPIVHQVFQVTGLAAAVHMDGSGITIPRQAAPGGEQGDGDGVGPSQLAAQLGTPVASL